ncbi:lycopene cyclase domain-containing protein [Specibacter sp. RAF43]|uniref:lycopene cyclase domain-containing protein n=1 Tax=Specibacter sp. RAF43 TaxID=3233057 RepID=UPI003F9CE13A
MNYGQLNTIFLAAALLVFAGALVRRGARLRRGAAPKVAARPKMAAAVVGTLVVLVALTAIFDNVMIGSGLFDYAGHTLAGVRVGLAPLEDFAYPLAASLLLPGLWLLLSGERPA